ncbi:hypothetical protein ABZ401_27040 [Streptomyces sp. NPDC005892]|uniref:hypothetical protein n=1 Tax=Streptomyces sp. NPDC005892 TaxID=3155593 RepID=UPI003402D500
MEFGLRAVRVPAPEGACRITEELGRLTEELRSGGVAEGLHDGLVPEPARIDVLLLRVLRFSTQWFSAS